MNSVTIFAFNAANKINKIENKVYMVEFLEKFSPRWGIPNKWLSKNLNIVESNEKLETVSVYGNIQIKLKLLPELMAIPASP